MTLEVILRLQAFSSAIRRTLVQYFIFQLTACSRGPSATAGLLMFLGADSGDKDGYGRFGYGGGRYKGEFIE